jgi:hypothetical protein
MSDDDETEWMTVHHALPLIQQSVLQAAKGIEDLLQKSAEGWLDISPQLRSFLEPLQYLAEQHDEPLRDTPDYYGAPKPIKLVVQGYPHL